MIKLHPGMCVHRWTVLGSAEPAIAASGKQRDRWLCRCECGVQKLVLGQNLRLALKSSTGGSRSCGCLVIDAALRHGHNRRARPSSEYMAWLAAKKRCGNPSSDSFERYGARGIRMCAAWHDNFERFLHDMGPKPDPAYSLDRIDPDGDYAPGNCRWAPLDVQNRNRSGVRWYEFEGQAALLGDIAEFLGIRRDEAKALERRGMLPARRLLNPPRVPDRLSPLILDLNLVAPGAYLHGVPVEE